MSEQADRSKATKRARRRRERLHQACIDLQNALDRDEPTDRLDAAIRQAQATIVAHVHESEADDGLLAQVIEEEPAFGSRVEAMQREHQVMIEQADALVEGAAGTLPPDELRDACGSLITLLDGHRHRATELLLDAFDLDLSAGD